MRQLPLGAALLWPMLISLTAALRFSGVQMPALVQRGASFWLACRFHLDPRLERLYSVKWYRNEEEFYRLQWGPGDELESGPGEQQHFDQPGVNVMMSSSNATHVRLLNASLESEGVYGCEISTQNLSTIRYDREIKVYVAAQSKPTIVGSKARYSLADQVDLICLSDFSRPQPALAWFINSHRIRQDSHWFQVSSELIENRLSDLYARKLRLRFKLTEKLVGAILANNDSDYPVSRGSDGKRRAALHLECRYRLTDVVDVVFNELQVSLDSSGLPAPVRGSSRWSQQQPEEALVLLSKSRNQLSQSVAPASAAHLAQALQQAQVVDSCDSSWTIGGHDPLLVDADKEPAAESGHISVNCSTALSLSPGFVTCNQDRADAAVRLPQTQRHLISGGWPQTISQRSSNHHKLTASAAQKPAHLWLQKSLAHSNSARVSLVELGLDPTATAADSSSPSAPEPQSPPPLLEWFINNQEAPKSSVRYQPQLPAGPATNSTTSSGWPQVAAPAVDLAHYFANFESRPQQQHLELQLDLPREKENLKISDSKLSLRCSSTQAQLLQTESTSFTIVVGYWADFAGSSKGHQPSIWQTHNTRLSPASSQQAKRQSSSSTRLLSPGTSNISWILSVCLSLVSVLTYSTNSHH